MLAAHTGVADQDLLEKDVRLHLLLQAIATDPDVGHDLIFKGGTCLIKCYLGYPRFSTDLDFTWRPVPEWGSLGTKELRRTLRPLQRRLLDRLRQHAGDQGLSIDDTDVHYGQSNRMMTVWLRYDSIARLPGFIKVQVNFLEELLFPVRSLDAHGMLGSDLPEAMTLLDSELPDRYAHPVRVEAYHPQEILAEKGRAVMTRQAGKTRDLLDLFLLESRLGFRIEDNADAIEAKTRTAVVRANHYREQLELVTNRPDMFLKYGLVRVIENGRATATTHERGSGDRDFAISVPALTTGLFEDTTNNDYQSLLLRPVDSEAFVAFRERALGRLADLARKVQESLTH